MKKKLIITILINLLITITGCSPQQYDVNIELSLEDAGEVVGEGTYESGEEVELAALSNEGYKFENWTVDEEVISDDKIHKIKIDEDLNLTANFKIIRRNKFAYVNINDGVDVRIGPFFEGKEVPLKYSYEPISIFLWSNKKLINNSIYALGVGGYEGPTPESAFTAGEFTRLIKEDSKLIFEFTDISDEYLRDIWVGIGEDEDYKMEFELYFKDDDTFRVGDMKLITENRTF